MGSTRDERRDDDWDDGRDESPNERADRNWDDLMQELRVMQTGAQILSGFLLAVAFQPRFPDLDDVQVGLYVLLVALAAASSLLALTPVALHRTHFAQGRKPELVRLASRIVTADLVTIGLLSIGVTTLIVDVAIGRGAALVATALGVVAVVLLWLVFPRLAGRDRGHPRRK